jgi:hypothetical protein
MYYPAYVILLNPKEMIFPDDLAQCTGHRAQSMGLSIISNYLMSNTY